MSTWGEFSFIKLLECRLVIFGDSIFFRTTWRSVQKQVIFLIDLVA